MSTCREMAYTYLYVVNPEIGVPPSYQSPGVRNWEVVPQQDHVRSKDAPPFATLINRGSTLHVLPV